MTRPACQGDDGSPCMTEGGIDGLLPFLESKAMLLDGPTARYGDVNL